MSIHFPKKFSFKKSQIIQYVMTMIIYVMTMIIYVITMIIWVKKRGISHANFFTFFLYKNISFINIHRFFYTDKRILYSIAALPFIKLYYISRKVFFKFA